jgi:hypothetical protein
MTYILFRFATHACGFTDRDENGRGMRFGGKRLPVVA